METLELIEETKTAPATQNISGSKAVLEAFIAEGVDTIFGYPGPKVASHKVKF